MKQLRCFVAMAFGSDDSDAIFDHIQKSFAKSIDIRRVDRINHNKDIDKKIIEELDRADFVIADLTYARPSVYWEAGYAQGRPIPVVYTARRDHIGKLATEDNRRVHFDLQMRNIIDWTSPNTDFVRRLKARVRLVTAPLIAERNAVEDRNRRRKEFAALSQYQQLESATKSAVSFFKDTGFRLTFFEEDDEEFGLKQRGLRLRNAIRMKGDTLQIGTVWSYTNLRKKNLNWFDQIGPLLDRLGNLNIVKRPPSRIDFVTFLLSLGRVSSSVLRECFPAATCDEQMTATLVSRSVYLPNRSLWKSGREIKPWPAFSSFHVGKDNVSADEKGTLIEKSYSDKRPAGKAEKCLFTRRIRVISSIIEPSDVSRCIQDTFSCFESAS